MAELNDLRAAYKEATGKNPAPNMSAETLQAKIDEALAATAAAEGGADDGAAADHVDEGAEAAAEAPAAAEEVPQAPPLTAYLDHDDEDASATCMGLPVVRGDNGLYLVPLAFVDQLTAHGFRLVSEGAR
jgi:hypothetical protein